MVELFRVEAENQTAAMTSGLLELEREPDGVRHLEALMRAAHSLKGAARIINLEVAVNLAHAMEDCFVAAQHGKIKLRKSEIDVLFRAIDLLLHCRGRVVVNSPWRNVDFWHLAREPDLADFITEPRGPVEPLTDAAVTSREGISGLRS